MGQFDLARNLLALTALATCPAYASETATYSYDALGRLTATTMSGTLNVGQTSIVSFDAANNRTCLSTSTAASTVPTLSICDAWVTESGLLTFVITRKGSAASAVGASWATSPLTATGGASNLAGVDYRNSSGTLSFAAGETSKFIQVPTYNTSVAEPTESFNITLTTPTGGAALGDAVATGWILDDD